MIPIDTLGLVNGDLVIESGNFHTITGEAKIRQDLALALSEEFGTDRFHPQWGSILRNYLGHVIRPELELLVKAEVIRVIKNYIAVQQIEIIADTQVDVKGRFNTSDVVRRIISVNSYLNQDAIHVAVTLETMERTTVTIRRQVVVP